MTPIFSSDLRLFNGVRDLLIPLIVQHKSSFLLQGALDLPHFSLGLSLMCSHLRLWNVESYVIALVGTY